MGGGGPTSTPGAGQGMPQSGPPGSVPGPILGGGNPGNGPPGMGSGHPLQDLLTQLRQNPGNGDTLRQLFDQWRAGQGNGGAPWPHAPGQLGQEWQQQHGPSGGNGYPGSDGDHVPVDPRIQRLKSKLQ